MRSLLLLPFALAAALPLGAQVRTANPAGPVLSLDEAVALARRNNPAHQQTANNLRSADIAVRSAFSRLVTPNVDAAFSTQFRQGGAQIFGGQQFGTSGDIRSSSYGVEVSYSLNAGAMIAPRAERALRDAVEADIHGSDETLRTIVTQQYLAVLQAQARAELQDTLVASAAAQVELAKARAAAGAATQLDVRRAEVTLGQAQVQSLREHNDVEIQKLRLFEQMGVMQPAGVALTTAFPLTPLSFTLDSVLALASRQNPGLAALRARERAFSFGVRQAQSAYTPSLNVATGWSGYTQSYTSSDFLVEGRRASLAGAQAQCNEMQELRGAAGLPANDDCSRYVLTDAQARSIRDQNAQYPFSFTRDPWSIRASVSMPIWDGLRREQRVQEARAARDDARYASRARELRLRAGVTEAYLTMTTALRTVELQLQNAARAREEVTLAEERYRVGAATYLDVMQSRSAFEQAESERINAIYEYHRAFAALENAVGHSLR